MEEREPEVASPGMEHSKSYTDEVWGQIDLSRLAVDIVNTQEFQRLDRIRQLGFTHFIHRKAKHTRFEHSVGVYHVSKRILERAIRRSSEVVHQYHDCDSDRVEALIEIVGCAGLLHDISHVPFAHTLEDEFKESYVKHDDLRNTRLWFMMTSEGSELAAVFSDENEPYFGFISNSELRDLLLLINKYEDRIELVGEEPNWVSFEEMLKQNLKLLESEEFQRLTQNSGYEIAEGRKMLEELGRIRADMSSKSLFEPYMSDTISNTICADIVDYLARDGKNTVEEHNYEEVENHMIIKKDSMSQRLRLVLTLFDSESGLKQGLLQTIIDLIRDRYRMALKVYYHDTKVSADVMLGKMLSIAGFPPDTNPYGGNGASTFHWEEMWRSIITMGDDDLFEYCRVRTAELTEEGREEEAKKLGNMWQMFRSRNLFRPLIVVQYNTGVQSVLKMTDQTGSVRTSNLFKELHRKFRRCEDAAGNVQNVEGRIDEMFSDDRHHILVFSAPHKRKLKQMDTFVELSEDEVMPLHIFVEQEHYLLPKPTLSDVRNLNMMYGELWKFLVLCNPDDLANEVTRSALAIRFWSMLQEVGIFVSEDMMDNYISHVPDLIPGRSIDVWANDNYIYTDGRVAERLQETSNALLQMKDCQEWSESVLSGEGPLETWDGWCADQYVVSLRGICQEQGSDIREDVENAEIWARIKEMADKVPEAFSLKVQRQGDDAEEGRVPHQEVLKRFGFLVE